MHPRNSGQRQAWLTTTAVDSNCSVAPSTQPAPSRRPAGAPGLLSIQHSALRRHLCHSCRDDKLAMAVEQDSDVVDGLARTWLLGYEPCLLMMRKDDDGCVCWPQRSCQRPLVFQHALGGSFVD